MIFLPKPKRAFALMSVVAITGILCLSIGAAVYWSQHNNKDNFNRLLLMESSSAAKMILEYVAADFYQNGIPSKPPGAYPIPTALEKFFHEYFPVIDTENSEIKVGTTTAPYKIYLDPTNPLYANDPLVGLLVNQKTTRISVKTVAQRGPNYPVENIYASMDVIHRSASYFAFSAFFDMDMELTNSSTKSGKVGEIARPIYCRGTLWCPGKFLITDSIIVPTPIITASNTGDYRHASPSWAPDLDGLTSAFLSSSWIGGINRFDDPYNPGSYTDDSAINNSSSTSSDESDYYDSKYDFKNNNEKYANWGACKKNLGLKVVPTSKVLPVPGGLKDISGNDAHYTINYLSPSEFSSVYAENYNPAELTRSALNPHWSYLEPCLSKNSDWYKGDAMESSKFFYNAGLIVKVQPYSKGSSQVSLTPLYSPDGTPKNLSGINLGLPNTSLGNNVPCSSTQLVGVGSNYSVNDHIYKVVEGSSNVAKPSRYDAQQLTYNVNLFTIQRQGGADGPPAYENGGLVLNYCTSKSFKPLNRWRSSIASGAEFLDAYFTNDIAESPVFQMMPYLSPKDSIGNNEYFWSSFYDPRRGMGIDALFVDVEQLYNGLRNGTYPVGYNSAESYTGVVYIGFPESVYNKPTAQGGDGLIYPTPDPSSNLSDGGNRPTGVRQQSKIPVGWGVVLLNGRNVPADNDALGFTIASNVPIYTVDSFGNSNSSGRCMLAADSVTILSPGFFTKQTASNSSAIFTATQGNPSMQLYYNNTTIPGSPLQPAVPGPNSGKDIMSFYTSILAGLSMPWVDSAGSGNSRGDGLVNTPRTIEDFSSFSISFFTTIFGFFESQVAGRPPLFNNDVNNNKPPYYALRGWQGESPPPGCNDFGYNETILGNFLYIPPDDYNKDSTNE